MQITNDRVERLAAELLRADSEDDVVRILTTAGLWTDPNLWRLYGDKEGNFAQAGNQQSLPEAALVEKVINCADARLMCECLLRKTDPESDAAPHSVRDAVALFFEGRRSEGDEAGTLANWPKAKRTEQSRFITVAATGDRPTQGRRTRKMCLTVVDQGEGQSASRLPKTILSLNAKNKQRIRFVQGKFNMGGSGALRFCGNAGLQLVISRRHPQLASREKADPTADEWCVTVVRREEPSNKSGEPIHSEFTYLAPVGADVAPRSGGVLSFCADTFAAMPEHDEPYAREIKWGTVIKLYEYETSVGQSNILMKDGLLFALERLLPEISLPVRLHECRGYQGEKERSFETPLAGLVVRLEDGKGDNLEADFPQSVQLKAASMNMRARIYAFKEDRAATYLRDEGVIFMINGQAHGYLPKSLFTRKAVGLPRLRDSLLVLVDCSSLTTRQREDLFMSSRDRLSKKPIRNELETEIEQLLRNNAELRKLQQERRLRDVENKLSDEKPLEEVLNKVLRASPTLKALFLRGQRLPKPFPAGGDGEGEGVEGTEEPEFVGRRHPSYFKVDGIPYGSVYHRNCEVGRRLRIRFVTDVENGYFERLTDRGTFDLEVVEPESGISSPSYSLTLENGEAHLNVALPTEVLVGERVLLQATVRDSTLVEPFVNMIELCVLPKQTRLGGPSTPRGKGKGGQSDNRQSSLGITMPKVIPVKEGDEHWGKYKFDGNTACHVISDPVEIGGKTRLEHIFYINVDNASLRTEMKYSKQDARLLEAKFKYGNVLLGLAMLHENGDGNGVERPAPDDQDQGEPAKEDHESMQDRIRKVTGAVAPVLIPMIDQLSGLQEDDLTLLGDSGEDE